MAIALQLQLSITNLKITAVRITIQITFQFTHLLHQSA